MKTLPMAGASLARVVLRPRPIVAMTRRSASLAGDSSDCVSRALAVEPEVLLMNEPCSALDPVATAKIEQLMLALKERYTMVVVTRNMQQAARVSDYAGLMLMGELVELGVTKVLFTKPSDKRTEDYITGRCG